MMTDVSALMAATATAMSGDFDKASRYSLTTDSLMLAARQERNYVRKMVPDICLNVARNMRLALCR